MMKNDHFTKNIGWATILLLGVLSLDVLERFPGFIVRFQSLRRLDLVVKEMHNGALNADDVHALTAGYYEGIEHTARIAPGAENNDYRISDNFLRYELKPNVKRRYPAGMRITNSLGMPNPEYSYQKPPHTRRIALLGDSISLGPYGHDFVSLLETRLNQAYTTDQVHKFQILNFAVPGYSLLQMMDVALEKTSKFHPDAYMVELSSQEVLGSRNHVVRLVTSGTDLKYDFLRALIARAGIRPTDRGATIRMKLAPFFLPLTHWALEQIQQHASAEGAQIIILLVPAVIDANVSAADFDQLRPAVDGIGVPVIDLRDTFRSARLSDFQVVPGVDIHPNLRGHELIFENLYAKVLAQPGALATLAGNGLENAKKVGTAPTGNHF